MPMISLQMETEATCGIYGARHNRRSADNCGYVVSHDPVPLRNLRVTWAMAAFHPLANCCDHRDIAT